MTNFAYPGYLSIGDTLFLTGERKTPYPGKIILLVDERVQSISEISTMMFQAIPQTVVIGRQTGGTVSTISRVFLPGHFIAEFTNVCLTYPDGSFVQGNGVKIDISVPRTLQGIQSGTDEILEAALRYLGK
ncbi:MAG: S41 family peptidase [Bacteroidota bacterium]